MTMRFFEAHATEAVQDLRAYAAHVHALTTKKSGLIRVLDFGCGSGKFTTKFLSSSISSGATAGFVVEPDEVYRQQAIEQLEVFTAHRVQAWPVLESLFCFDW